MHRPLLQSVALLLGAALASAAAGQSSVELEPVDPNIADVSPLSVSLRSIELGLQQPVEFSRIFAVPGHEGHYMRVHGGVYAVFPRSVYVQTKAGLVPDVPPDTVYYIGAPPPDETLAPPRRPTAGDRFRATSTRLAAGRTQTALAPPEGVPPDAPALFDGVPPEEAHEQLERAAVRRFYTNRRGGVSIAEDLEYRKRRMRELMDRAVAAATAGSPEED